MNVKDEEFKTKIYDLMNGSYNLEEYPVAESSFVKDEFAEGEYCEKLYSQMLEGSMRGYAEDLESQAQKMKTWRVSYRTS